MQEHRTRKKASVAKKDYSHLSQNAHEITKVVPSRNYMLHCPFCDKWKLIDSMVARKKLGLHLVNEHDEEVRFKEGIEPPALEEV